MTRIIAWGQYVFPSNLFQPPGNSLRTIDAAFSCGYDGIELDVQLSRDGELVLMHDHTLDRTTLSSGAVADRTVAEPASVELKDPWSGPPCHVETLATALRRVADRGQVMVDMHHATPRSVAAVARSVAASGFDPARLLLLTYTTEGGQAYKRTFPDATVLLKAPHNAAPPALNLSILAQAEPLDGVLMPLMEHRNALCAFREATRQAGLQLAVYMHKTGTDDLLWLMRLGVDYVTSYSPQGIGRARRTFAQEQAGVAQTSERGSSSVAAQAVATA